MDRIVIDANVCIKLFVNEEYSENAYALRDAYVSKAIDIAVPSLFPYEVLNAIKYSKSYNEEELERIGEALENYKFGVFNFETKYAREIIRFSEGYSITVYDAAYVALASLLNTKLYTSDDKLIRALNLPFVIHIREFRQ